MAGNKGRAREGFPEEVSLRKSAQGFVVGCHHLRLEGNNHCTKGSPWPLRT